MPDERIPLEEFQARVAALGLPSNHVAFRCPICGTVQSMASLVRAGVPEDTVESVIGFSCEGRWTGAGPAVPDGDTSPKAVARRAVRGCDWTLGGLFRLHPLEVLTPTGVRECFALATVEEAEALRRELAAA